jgi:hypothetical protein
MFKTSHHRPTRAGIVAFPGCDSTTALLTLSCRRQVTLPAASLARTQCIMQNQTGPLPRQTHTKKGRNDDGTQLVLHMIYSITTNIISCICRYYVISNRMWMQYIGCGCSTHSPFLQLACRAFAAGRSSSNAARKGRQANNTRQVLRMASCKYQCIVTSATCTHAGYPCVHRCMPSIALGHRHTYGHQMFVGIWQAVVEAAAVSWPCA